MSCPATNYLSLAPCLRFSPSVSRNDVVGLKANVVSEAALAAAPTNSPNGEYAWRLPTLLPLLGDHKTRSVRLLWGNKIVAGLGSHWAGVRASLCLQLNRSG